MSRIKQFFNLKSRFNGYFYNRYAHSALSPSFDASLIHTDGYYSQCGQDKWIVKTLLPNLRDGFFVDIGAHDGISFSNTCFLEKIMNWRGIAIEPNPEVFTRLKDNRSCDLVNGCISNTSGKAKFYKVSGYAEMLSGIYDQYDSRHLQRIEREILTYGGSYEVQEVDAFLLDQVLADRQIFHIDYLNIDVEGAELSILKSIDFNTFDISIIGCENNYKDFRIPKFLSKHGYILHSIVGDEFYVKPNII